MRLLKWLLILIVAALGGAAVAYVAAGRADGPAITIDVPDMIGHAATLRVAIEVPGARLDGLTLAVEQDGRTLSLAAEDAADGAARDDPDRFIATRAVGGDALPDLRAGSATVVVTASRPLLRGWRSAVSTARREIEVRLDPPRLSVLSSQHYVNQGGSELVVYRVDPPDASSGVVVGDLKYPGFSLAEAGLAADPTVWGAFFAVRYDQSPDTPVAVYATDPAGNQARASFPHRIVPKRFRHSRITITDAFLEQVVPPLAAEAVAASGAESEGDLLASFLALNGALRRENAEEIAGFAARTAPRILWRGAFRRLRGSQTESGFADDRTYVYQGKTIDRQVHLGFDLASTVHAPIEAANRGVVLYTGPLGIYGNAVILDHGLGVQSLYAHLSSFAVSEGQQVEQGDELGRTGQTGLAGGDHLHFSMLVNGQFVNAVEWWDAHWIEDRIERKLDRIAAEAAVAP